MLGGAGPELVQAAAGAECRRGRQAQHLAAEAPFGPGLGPVIAAAPVELEAAGCVLERSREYPNRGESRYVRVYLDCDLPKEVSRHD